jgi:transcriptional regulator with XRE-family HTH domain
MLPDESDLGPRLKETREYLGMSQSFVAEHTGLPRSAVSDIERGLRRVSTIELKRLAKVFGVSTHYFLGDEREADESHEVRALARLVGDLSPTDREELIRFAKFLRHSSTGRRRET